MYREQGNLFLTEITKYCDASQSAAANATAVTIHQLEAEICAISIQSCWPVVVPLFHPLLLTNRESCSIGANTSSLGKHDFQVLLDQSLPFFPFRITAKDTDIEKLKALRKKTVGHEQAYGVKLVNKVIVECLFTEQSGSVHEQSVCEP